MRPVIPFRPMLVIAVAALSAAGCGASASATPAWTYGPLAASSPTASPSSAAGDPMADMPGMAGMADMPAAQADVEQSAIGVSYLNLTIVTGDMIGHTEYPAYIPSNPTLPANSTVVVTITNFDDATALPSNMTQYAAVAGTVADTIQVTPINLGDPNGASGPTTAVTKLDPNGVSHTFTVPGLGINVPIAPHARTTFVIHTGAPGTFAWRCFDPCGTGATGWGSAMAAKSGFMEGTLTVA